MGPIVDAPRRQGGFCGNARHRSLRRLALCESRSLWLALVSGIALGVASYPAVGDDRPFLLSDGDLAGITAGGVVSDANSTAAAHGPSPRTRSGATASVDPDTGDASARGRGRGPAGSNGTASIKVAGDDGFATSADSDGASADGTATTVSAAGRGRLAGGSRSGGSVADARSGEAYTHSDTAFGARSGADSLEGKATADGFSGRRGASRSATDLQAEVSPGNLNQRLRSSSSGKDVTTAHARGDWRVQRAGRTIEVFTEAETASDRGSSAEISHVIIANGNGVLVRVSSGSRSTGRGMMDPSATSRIIAPGATEGIVALDRAARRAGEARSTSMMLITPQPAGPLK